MKRVQFPQCDLNRIVVITDVQPQEKMSHYNNLRLRNLAIDSDMQLDFRLCEAL